MKEFTCYDCAMVFQTESRDDILGQLYSHYMKDHQERIMGASQAEKKAWMEQFEKDWAAAA